MDSLNPAIIPCALESAGVDWLTATAYRSSERKPFYETGMAILEEVALQGNEISAWKSQGYHGRRAGGVAIGVRNDTWIARLSSDDARESWRRLYPLASNVSRLDVQVTFRLNRPDPTFIARQRARALVAPSKGGRKPNITLIQSSLDGDSIYLGKRTSDCYARCYDKGREERTEEAGRVIRQELEYKRDRAKSVAELLYRATSDETISRQLVSTFFKRRGFQTSSAESKLEVGARGITSSNEAKLAWLRSSVRPSIITLLNSGRLLDTLRALGLDKEVQPCPALCDEKPSKEI
jgi:hypothetical protein